MSLVFFKEILKFVLFSKIAENFSQITGPFARDGREGLQSTIPLISKMISMAYIQFMRYLILNSK